MLISQTYICITVSILLCSSCYGHAIMVGGEDTLSHLVGLLGVTHKYKIITRTPKRGEILMVGSVYNVKNYGAKGDGKTDDTNAFEAAWAATCGGKNNGAMLVPSGYTFLLQPIIFNGNKCQPNTTVQIEGEIVGPSKRSQWKNVGTQWIQFSGFSKGLTIKGNGVVDGRGQDWWESARVNFTKSQLQSHFYENEATTGNKKPHAIEIDNSNHVTVKGITIQNSPQMHIYFSNCKYVTISGLTVSSPGNSPNTDGIHLSQTQHVNIYKSTLGCGDDCISIQSGCSDVTIKNVNCGPGHGYSIGSLGYGGAQAQVSGIGVYDSTASSTSNGVRIKTWEGATGSLKNITFKNIIMSNVDIPILIDQYYCNGSDFCKPTGKANAVVISGVNFKNITGTYTKRPIALVCSASKPCKGITVAAIDLDPSNGKDNEIKNDATLYCSNAYGQVLTKTNPSFQSCLKSG